MPSYRPEAIANEFLPVETHSAPERAGYNQLVHP